MQTSLGGIEDNSRDLPVMQTYDRIQAAFPSEGSMELVVVKADDVTAPKVVSAIESLEDKAAKRPGLYEGSATLDVSKDQTVATLLFPTNGSGTDELSIKAMRHAASTSSSPPRSARWTESRPTPRERPPRPATSMTP